MITEWQAHGGAVNTSTSPKVQYAYSEMASSANHSRLTSTTYPSGYVLTFNYSSGLNSNVSRLSSISDSSGSLESYEHLGYGTVVIRGHSQPGVDLTYVGTPADGGDQYAGLDRFGRVVDQKWVKSGTPTDRFQYGYDRNSNRTYRDNLVNTGFGEVYTYDNLGQLVSFDRGTLNGTKTGISGVVARSQDWDYDALGNWDSLVTDGSTQTRTANAQNEITSVSGATTPTYDANGNMTQAENGLKYDYDAWNRLVTVKNSGGTTLKSYTYDALNRRVTETASSVTTDVFYSDQWQVLEEKVSSNTTRRYVWSPVYIDAMILRDRDTDGNGTLDERLWVIQDANWNVTALVDGSGTVVERYVYDPFGVVTVHDAIYGVRGGGSSFGWDYLFQGLRRDNISGLDGDRYRRYSATLSVWMQNDPLRYAGGDINFYSYVGNNPLRHVDPSGLIAIPVQSLLFTQDCFGFIASHAFRLNLYLSILRDYNAKVEQLSELFKEYIRLADAIEASQKILKTLDPLLNRDEYTKTIATIFASEKAKDAVLTQARELFKEITDLFVLAQFWYCSIFKDLSIGNPCLKLISPPKYLPPPIIFTNPLNEVTG